MAEHAFILAGRDYHNQPVVKCAYCNLVATTVQERLSHEECEVHTRSIAEAIQETEEFKTILEDLNTDTNEEVLELDENMTEADKKTLARATTEYKQSITKYELAIAEANRVLSVDLGALEDPRITKLKNNWLKDPCWDIETTEGFEEYSKETLSFRLETEAADRDREETRKVKKALQLICSIQMIEYLEKLEARIKECEKLIDRLND